LFCISLQIEVHFPCPNIQADEDVECDKTDC
jgi:hypothetical protein